MKSKVRLSLNQSFLKTCKYSEEQKKEFIELYEKFYKYVYKYEVGYEEDFDIDDPTYCTDMQHFEQDIYDEGMMIKVNEGY